MTNKPDIKELAVCVWRLEKWLDNLNADRKMAAKSALRGIKKYISACGIELRDPIGSKFDPGLAVEVVNNEAADAPEAELIIIETLAPYIYQDGKLIQHARVIIGISVKESKTNNEIVAEELAKSEISDFVQAVSEDEAATTNLEANNDIIFDEKDIEKVMAYAKIL